MSVLEVILKSIFKYFKYFKNSIWQYTLKIKKITNHKKSAKLNLIYSCERYEAVKKMDFKIFFSPSSIKLNHVNKKEHR